MMWLWRDMEVDVSTGTGVQSPGRTLMVIMSCKLMLCWTKQAALESVQGFKNDKTPVNTSLEELIDICNEGKHIHESLFHIGIQWTGEKKQTCLEAKIRFNDEWWPKHNYYFLFHVKKVSILMFNMFQVKLVMLCQMLMGSTAVHANGNIGNHVNPNDNASSAGS